MGVLDKIFSLKGNRQFSQDEDLLIEALNNTENFIADEAFINFTHTELFAIDKELKKFIKIEKKEQNTKTNTMPFEAISSYQSLIKDRANEDWLTDFSKWKTQKKFIRSISLNIESDSQENLQLDFILSENKDGDRVASIPVKRALFSLDKWDKVLFEILESKNAIAEEND